MSALMIARIKIKDEAKFQEYLVKSKELAGTYGAELVFRGKKDRNLNGDTNHKLVVIAKFPSIEQLNAWFDSDAYQPLIALREEGSDMEMTSYELAA